uniref:Anti-sigma factor n=1 Tax=uncultured Thiotrichaceae bacterium TaxID=298394 RepID=A0A6S6UKR8_9GAMM|nr:MAG: Unknown protein [uncultured Thiotrichaceae bacterium]
MEVQGWLSWLKGLLILLLLLAVAWFGLRWMDIRAEDWVMGKNLPLQTRYEELNAQEDTVHGSWLRTLNPLMKDVQGGLIWNSSEQEGVMHLVGLPDPKIGFQYHLWIHDSRGSSGVPVSGGVLSEGSGKYEQFVMIEPKAHVTEPFKFELMLEPLSGKPEEIQVMLMVQP